MLSYLVATTRNCGETKRALHSRLQCRGTRHISNKHNVLASLTPFGVGMSENIAVMRHSLSEAVKIDQGMLRYVLDQSRDCIKILGPSGEIQYINSEGRCRLAITDYSKVCGQPWQTLWPAESRAMIDEVIATAQAGESSEIEAFRTDSTGETKWWRVSVSPLLERNNELAGILTISRDVTEHVQLRESEKTMAMEMRHRLRNAYTIASAILMQSARGNPTAQPFAEKVASRLADVALSQTRLLEAGEKKWALSELIQTLVAAHGDGALGIRYAGDADATVDGHHAMLVALIIGELTTNSHKYGALRQSGAVSLSWTIEQGHLVLQWREPLLTESTDTFEARNGGSGYSLMKRMAQAQRANFEHQIADGELLVSLTLPGSA
jgi:PAS domain S-box-containing protein